MKQQAKVFRRQGIRKVEGYSREWPFSVGERVEVSAAGKKVGIRPRIATVTALVLPSYTASGDLRQVAVRSDGCKGEGIYHATFWQRLKSRKQRSIA